MSYTKANMSWITHGITNNDPIKWAESFGEYLAKDQKKTNEKGKEIIVKKKLSASQLRRFFGHLKRLQAEGYHPQKNQKELLMLQPQLAYAVGRDKGESKIKELADELIKMIAEVAKAKPDDAVFCFNNFISLTEAVVAYHKINES